MSKFFPIKTFKYLDKKYIDNISLYQNKFYCEGTEKNKVKYSSLLCNYNKNWLCNENISNMLTTIKSRTEKLAQSFRYYANIEYSPQSRLMIGTGSESPYSTVLLMTFHQTYGFPYIPATAIKGCLRSYCEQEKPTGFDINKLLGSSEDKENSKGHLIFFDTFPTDFYIEFDSLTPHNPEYYNDKGKYKPSDSDNKIPLAVPCLSNKSKFNIYIACTDADIWNKDKDIVVECLKNALADYGLGGKTSYGYGLSQ